MVLTDKQIRAYSMRKDAPLIVPFHDEQLQGASYDVTLSGEISVFRRSIQTIDLDSNTSVDQMGFYERREMGTDGYVLQPNEYILVQLQEKLTIPTDCVAHLRPRTRFTRIGLLVAPQHCNPTYSGMLFVGIHNASPNALRISKGLKVAQVIFERTDGEPSEEKQYKNKPDSAYMDESSFRGHLPDGQGWTPDLEKTFNELLESLNIKR